MNWFDLRLAQNKHLEFGQTISNAIIFYDSKSLFERSEAHRWRADGVRVENIPRIHNIGHRRRDSKIYGINYSVNFSSTSTGSSSCQCTTTLYGKNRETQKHVRKICYSYELCSQILAGALVILGTWIRKEMVRNLL